jgi:hypothetical protein
MIDIVYIYDEISKKKCLNFENLMSKEINVELPSNWMAEK